MPILAKINEEDIGNIWFQQDGARMLDVNTCPKETPGSTTSARQENTIVDTEQYFKIY